MICSFETCERAQYAKGYCNGHWQQLRHRGGDTARLTPFRKVKRGALCEVPRCDRPVEGQGMCQTHVKHFRKTGEIKEIQVQQSRESWEPTCWITWCDREPTSKGYCSRHNRVTHQYNLTVEQVQTLFDHPECDVCGSSDPGKKDFHIDHDHSCCDRPGSCGKCVRGLLCGSCNRAMGNAKDDPHVLRRMADYLERGSL